jgi:hypothetical protein
VAGVAVLAAIIAGVAVWKFSPPEPMPVAEGVDFFSASANGVLVHNDSRSQGGAAAGQELVWMDRKGTKTSSASGPGEYINFRLSGDEKRIAFNRTGSASQPDVWVQDLVRGVPSRLTFDPACDNLPIWSPDGLRVLFPSNRNGSFDLYLKLL